MSPTDAAQLHHVKKGITSLETGVDELLVPSKHNLVVQGSGYHKKLKLSGKKYCRLFHKFSHIWDLH